MRGSIFVDRNASPTGEPRLRLGVTIFVFLQALVLAQALFAYQDSFLTTSQMLRKGVNSGLPLLWHFGIWGDLLVVSPLSALIVAYYSRQWTPASLVLSGLLGLAISAAMHWSYTFSPMPEAHIQGHRLTRAGMAHFVYMALALAVFLQLFFFTPHIASRALRGVSVLAFIHVVAGTHMALGIVSVLTPLEWYPGQPLQSVTGWLIIVSLGIFLLWRNFGFNIFKKFFECYLYWTGNNISNTEGLFKFLSEICRVVAIWTYLSVMGQIAYRYWNGKIFDVGGFLSEGFLECVLLGSIGLTYWFGQLSVKQEIGIAKTIFPPAKIPNDWGTPRDRKAVVVLVLLFCAFYLVLAHLSPYIAITAAIMTVLAINDYHTRYKINEGVRKYFSDDFYSPRPGEKDFVVIKARRFKVEHYLFCKPHFKKEALRIIGCACSFVLAIAAHLYGERWLEIAAYLVLIIVLLVNEVVTVRWRLIRDSRLRKVDQRAGQSRMPA